MDVSISELRVLLLRAPIRESIKSITPGFNLRIESLVIERGLPIPRLSMRRVQVSISELRVLLLRGSAVAQFPGHGTGFQSQN